MNSSANKIICIGGFGHNILNTLSQRIKDVDIVHFDKNVNIDDIKAFWGNHTERLFVIAGMGGGTGTQIAPFVARVAKNEGIFTIGLCTKTFRMEGLERKKIALKGIDDLGKNVDLLVILNNDEISTMYGNLGFKEAFSKADEVIIDVINFLKESNQNNIGEIISGIEFPFLQIQK